MRLQLLRTIQETKANRGPQNSAYLVVDRLRRNFSLLYRGQQGAAVHEFTDRHLQIQAIDGGCYAIVGGVPIRHENAAEPPFFFENIEIQMGVLGGVNAVHQVIGIHHRAHMSLANRSLECR